MVMNKKGASFGAIVAIIGSILIALGFAWLIAQNWHQIPSPLKIIILLGLTSGAFVAGTFLIKKDYPAIGKALFVLGCLLYTLSIFLIAQIFFVRGGWQGMAWLWLIAWIGVIAAAYIFDSSAGLIIGLTEIIIWLIIQFLAFTETEISTSWGILALLFLAVGVLLYGLNLLHHYYEHRFARIYRWWTAFYFLSFTYILSFQLLLPHIWPKEATVSASVIIFLFALSGIAIGILAGGAVFFLRDKKSNPKEIFGFIGIVILLIILISSTSLVSDVMGSCQTKTCNQITDQASCNNLPKYLSCQWNNNVCEDKSCYTFYEQSPCEKQSWCKWDDYSCNFRESCQQLYDQNSCENSNLDCTWAAESYCYNKDSCSEHNTPKSCSKEQTCNWYSNSYGWYGAGGNYPLSLWVLWIIINLFFIALIVGIIGYGTWQKMSSLINLGIVFFALSIITRYIGFIMDFRGYVGLSVFFIIGGILLLGGGWLVERWRKKLIASAK